MVQRHPLKPRFAPTVFKEGRGTRDVRTKGSIVEEVLSFSYNEVAYSSPWTLTR